MDMQLISLAVLNILVSTYIAITIGGKLTSFWFNDWIETNNADWQDDKADTLMFPFQLTE